MLHDTSGTADKSSKGKCGKILFLTTVLPEARSNGGEYASQTIIDSLDQLGYEVVVVGYRRKGDGGTAGRNTVTVGARHIETASAGLSPLYWMGFSLVKNLPYSAAKYYSGEYVASVKRLLKEHSFDLVVIDHAQVGWIIRYVKEIKNTVFVAHNVEKSGYLYQAEQKAGLAKSIYLREARLIENLDLECAGRASELWAMTDADAEYFRKQNERCIVRVLNLPSAKDTVSVPDRSSKFDIGLIGSWDWSFNREGLEWFFKNVYPALSGKYTIQVAGRGGENICTGYQNVVYRGFVPDAMEFLSEAKVIAVPTLGGSGLQIKTLEALSTGTRIVATSHALRGIESIPMDVNVSDNADEFASELRCAIDEWKDSERQSTARTQRGEWMKSRRECFLNALNNSIDRIVVGGMSGG